MKNDKFHCMWKRGQALNNLERIPYHPQMDMQQLAAFDERLRHVSGSWNTIGRSYVHAGASGVIHLRWLIMGERWCNEDGFLHFLDSWQHRQLLRYFLRQKPPQDQQQRDRKRAHTGMEKRKCGWQRIWKEDALFQKMEPKTTRKQFIQALQFLALQEYITAQDPDTWVSSSLLEPIKTFDATFAWCVQAHLQNHHALTRRSVSFREWQTSHLNDLDVLAFTEEGLIMTVACTSGQDLSSGYLVHFVQRARDFPADIALLFIDTESESQVTKHLRQINIFLKREPMDFGHRYMQDGSVVYHLIDNIYVANTAGGIEPALVMTLQLGSSITQTDEVSPENGPTTAQRVRNHDE
jgi:hypothetical protein